MPKRFAIFLLIAQVILTLAHFLLYCLILLFFPALFVHHVALLVAILILSLSFLVFSTLVHFYNNMALDICYIAASIFLVFNIYFLFFLVPSAVGFWIFGPAAGFLGLLAFAITLTLIGYGLINARIIRVTEIKIHLPNLPAPWVGKIAVVAADMHLGNILRNGSAKKAVKLINKQNPDIVFVPGDYFDGGKTDFQTLANELKGIKAPLGTFYSSGNHELYAGYAACEQAIKNAGVRILEDEKVVIDGLQIVGLAYTSETDESVSTRLQKLDINPSQPSLLLKHVPNHFAAVEKAGINFQISGHSHRGQIWPGPWITKKVWKGYNYGLKLFGKLQIYTSSGVGTWGPPLRAGSKSEIVKIIFN